MSSAPEATGPALRATCALNVAECYPYRPCGATCTPMGRSEHDGAMLYECAVHGPVGVAVTLSAPAR